MYIKQLVIQGFKTFKDQIYIEPFHPRHNVIVGRNGSGKSNFFFAIEFVLSDAYTNMRPEERASLLHEGAGLAVMSAFVEIIFDNEDGRFPVDKEEVVLRRTIGLKKDEFFLDKKHVTKQEIYSLLESAGFSRSNPYYIVRQGRVNELATMKDTERLDLLKEVAGTKVYDERRRESLKIMEDTDRQREKITEVLTSIEERLQELESEKEELKEYQKLDREKRCLEYTIYNKELEEVTSKLEELEAERSGEGTKATELFAASEEVQTRLQACEKEQASLTAELAKLKREKLSIDEERQEYVKARAKAELSVRDGQETLQDQERLQKKMSAELAGLAKEIKVKEKEKATITPKFAAKAAEEKELKERLQDAEASLAALYAKQTRQTQFKSKAERDAWIKDELKTVQASSQGKQTEILKLEGEIKKVRKALEKAEKDEVDLADALTRRKELIEKRSKDFQAFKKERDELNNARKELHKKDNELDTRVTALVEERRKYERALEGTMNKQLCDGLNAVKQITAEKGVEGVYGPLIELFQCEDTFFTCVEVTGGSSLFNVVVDTDDTAAVLLAELNKRKAGRVTFMPLNRLQPKEVKATSSEDAIPMIEKLDFDPHFTKAMKQIFGRTLICRNLEVASAFSKSENMNCVTLEGEQVSNKGAFTGGFIDKKTSKLNAMARIKECRENLEGSDADLQKCRTRLAELDQEVARALAEMEKVKGDVEQQKQTYEQMKVEARSAREDHKEHSRTLEAKEKALEEAQTSLKGLKDEVARMKAELATDISAKLTKAEQQTAERLNKEVPQLKKELLAASDGRSQLEADLAALTALLENNLLKRQRELTEQLDEMGMRQQSHELETQEQDLGQLEEEIADVTARQKENDTAIDSKSKRLQKVKDDADELKSELDDLRAQLQNESKNVEKMLGKRNTLLQRKDESTRKIRELGSLPQDAFEKYRKTNQKQLMKLLHKCNESLKKYSHVNKKALDQYVNFSEQRDDLGKRKEELDAGAQSIRELIETLDQKKDEAITRTFKGVAKAFTEVFKELVPHGEGRIVMNVPREAQEEGGSKIDRYSAVSIKISFTGDDGTHDMQQLSGGQKSLVALTLLFAIQRTMGGGVKDSPDSAPFYLFDEIDSALDAAHRTAVANLIHRQAEHAQFITTTFWPELCEPADKFYLVSYSKKTKTSSVQTIDKSDAREFLERLVREEGEPA